MSCEAVPTGEDRCTVSYPYNQQYQGNRKVNAVLLVLYRSQLSEKMQLVFVLCAAQNGKKLGMAVR